MIELASILVLSVFAQWLAWKMKIPAILPLIIIGLLMGPFSTFFTPNGQKLLDGDQIFSGDLLFSFVAISVGVILFEGGLTLKIKEIRHQVGVVRNLLIFGPIVTLGLGGVAAHYLIGLDYKLAFLFGALIIVSGPTVVIPILRNVRPNEKINNVLKWEGILIDPIGALIAVLMYEFIQNSDFHNEETFEVFKEFFITIATGVFVGAIAALFLKWVLEKNRIPGYLKNVFALGLVIFVFTFSELLQPEAGLMAATFMGIMLANMKVEDLKKILSFKEDVSIILISVLFILLSSRIDYRLIEKLGWESAVLFGIVVLVIRPLYVWLSTRGGRLNWREVVFMSWVGPKGIVAAAVASLFSLQLMSNPVPGIDPAQAELVLPLTFLMIVGTVIFQGSTAKPFAKILKVTRSEPQGFLIAGANENARFIARVLTDHNLPFILADTSKANVRESEKQGFDVYQGDILGDSVFEELDLTQVGRMMALTSSSEINSLAIQYFAKEFGEDQVYRLPSKKELDLREVQFPRNVLFAAQVDYLNLAHAIRQKGDSKKVECNSDEDYQKLQKQHKGKIIPLFVVKESGKLNTVLRDLPDFQKGDKLIYLPLSVQEASSSKVPPS